MINCCLAVSGPKAKIQAPLLNTLTCPLFLIRGTGDQFQFSQSLDIARMIIDSKVRSRRTAQWTPDVVIGIDFGSVGTAVAVSSAPYWPEAELITSWPGLDGNVLATKVPSRISYYKNNPNQVKSWGFRCDHDNEDEDIKKSFKAALDPDHYGQAPDRPSLRAACRYTVDFLRCIYQYICSHLASFSLESPERKVQFLFSVPSSWAKSRTQDRFRALVATAGFNKHPQHRINIDMSEAEATAFSALPYDAKSEAAVLICHTGALFTELALLQRVTSTDVGYTYKTKAWTRARFIGSARIDYQVHDLIKDSLHSMNKGQATISDSLPRKMMQGRYRTYKNTFGSEEPHFSTLDLPIQDPNVDMYVDNLPQKDFSMEEADFRALVDQQLDKLIAVIEQELDAAQELLPGKDILLVMSGGFSDNPHLRKRFDVWNSVTKHLRKGYNVAIIFTADGKLQVVQGLIVQQIRARKLNHHVLSPLGYDREIWGAIIRKLENINLTNSFSQVEDTLNEDMPTLSSQFKMLQALYKTALPMLDLEERVYIDKAFKDTDRSLRKIHAAPGLDWANSASSIPDHRTKQSDAAKHAEMSRSVHQTLQVLQHLGIVAEFLQEVLETRSAFGSALQEVPREESPDKGKPTTELGMASRSGVTMLDAEWLSLGTSRASSIITTRTKLSTTTTLEEDQHSLDLIFDGMPFHIAHDGSRITSGNEPENAPPPYSPAPA